MKSASTLIFQFSNFNCLDDKTNLLYVKTSQTLNLPSFYWLQLPWFIASDPAQYFRAPDDYYREDGIITEQVSSSATADLLQSSQASPSALLCTHSLSAWKCCPWHSNLPPETKVICKKNLSGFNFLPCSNTRDLRCRQNLSRLSSR